MLRIGNSKTVITTLLAAYGFLAQSQFLIADIIVTGSVSPSSPTNPDWSFGNSLRVGNTGEGSLTADSGSKLTGREVRIGRGGGTSSVSLTGNGTSLAANAVGIVVGDTQSGATASHGIMNIESGATASGQSGVIANRVNTSGVVNVTGNGSTWTNGGLYVGGNTQTAGGVGTLNISDSGAVQVFGSTKIWGSGTINLAGGSLKTSFLDASAVGAKLNVLGGILDAGVIQGDINQASGVLAASSITGNLTQTGGTLSPGASPGTTSIAGDYDFLSGNIKIELGGTAHGTQYDFIDVTGEFAIGATDTFLDISFVDSFEASILATDLFTIAEADQGVLGEFFGRADGATIQTSDGLGAFQINYTANSIVLSNFTAVPEPSSALFAGLSMLLVRFRRNRASGLY